MKQILHQPLPIDLDEVLLVQQLLHIVDQRHISLENGGNPVLHFLEASLFLEHLPLPVDIEMKPGADVDDRLDLLLSHFALGNGEHDNLLGLEVLCELSQQLLKENVLPGLGKAHDDILVLLHELVEGRELESFDEIGLEMGGPGGLQEQEQKI